MKTFRWLLPAVIVTAVLSGCYTQFVMVDKTPPKEEVSWVVDSATGDTVKVINRTDTVHTQDQQTCIWVRDLMGYPYLRCYDSFYPRDWYYYNYSPWWYYDYPYYSGGYYSGGYYYGGRRYYRRYHEGGERGPVKTEPSGSSYRSRVRGVPDPKTAGSLQKSGAAVSTGSSDKSANTGNSAPEQGKIIIPGEEGKKTIIVHERRSGVPKAGTAAPVPVQKETPATTQPKSAEVHPSTSAPAPSKPSAAPPKKSSQQQPSPQQNDGERRPRRRNPRSW
jgi:hypothetical protein